MQHRTHPTSDRKPHQLGFTLVEMAIVLAVVGVLAAGLYTLLSGASSQVRDQSAANQQLQLISATKAFLNSINGQNYMTFNSITTANGGCNGANCGDPPSSYAIPLPTVGSTCPPLTSTGDTNLDAFCSFLPPGFNKTTTNSYGQTYSVRFLRDTTTVGFAPATYTFMVMTVGGNTISDTDGARITSLIGGDGGFIYTNNVCGTPPNTFACGAFGGWNSLVTSFGFAAGVSGTAASRTFVSPQTNSFNTWLARVTIPGDVGFTLNSMTTPEFIGGTPNSYGNELDMGNPASSGTSQGGSSLNLEGGVFNFGYNVPIVVPAPTGVMNVQGGTINLGGGTIISGTPGGGTYPINFWATAPSTLINLNMVGGGGGSAALNVSTGCTSDQNSGAIAPPLPYNAAGCAAGIQVSGDEIVLGELTANSLFAETFYYSASDIRLKTNIEPIANALNEIMRLKPVAFNFKSNGQKGLGLIAQEVEKIFPELVQDNKHGMKAVNYDGLIAPLISAVQELKEENDQLRAELKQHQDRLDQLDVRHAKPQ